MTAGPLWSGRGENDQGQSQDQDIDRGPAPGAVGRLFLRVDVFATDRCAGVQAGNATNVDATSEANACAIDADSFEEAVIRATLVEAARDRSKHPVG
jgi:hypothetical protein